MTKEMTKIAVHEASHGFICWHSGGVIEQVTIVGPTKDQSPYHCRFKHRSALLVALDEFTVEDVFIRIMLDLAPAAVEVGMLGKPSYGALLHIRQAMDFLAWKNPEIRKISDRAREIQENSKDWEEAAKQFFNEFGDPVKELVNTPQALKAIDGLAELLLERDKLTGFEAVICLEKSWREPLPEKALSAEKHSSGVGEQGLKSRIKSAARLNRMAMEILQDHRPKNEIEEEILEKAIERTLGSIFSLEELNVRVD